MSVKALQDLLISTRGTMNRPEVADRAESVRGGHPDFDAKDIEKLENMLRRPPMDGLKLRTHCAAIGLPLLEALAALDYWPPLEFGPRKIVLSLLQDFCSRHRVAISHHDPDSGRVVIQL